MMIRRVIIPTIALTTVAARISFLSHVWQFGYTGSWFTIGMREGTFWYVWRSAPISDALGWYSDTASAVNRAMFNINATARFNDEPTWGWVVGFAAFVGSVFLLVAAFRIARFRAPRWLTILFLSATLLSAVTWLGSQFGSVQYNGTRLVCGVYDGTLSIYATVNRSGVIAPGLGRAPGWDVGAQPPWLRMNFGDWVSISGGLILINLPVAILVLALLPPTILCAKSRRRKPGHCSRCDYDLTGNQSGICPECGTSVAAVRPAGSG